jgi:hypothetical protein
MMAKIEEKKDKFRYAKFRAACLMLFAMIVSTSGPLYLLTSPP